MSAKSPKLRASLSFKLGFKLSLFLTAFGVYSVSSVSTEASSYPYSTSTASIKYSRSSRETSKTQKSTDTQTPDAPFAPGTHNLSLGVGQVFLLGELGNNYDNAIGPELHYAYGVSDLFAFESNFGYHAHSRNTSNVSIWNLSAGVRSNLMYFDRLIPYFNIDLGFYHPSFTYPVSGSASTTLFGLQLGMGLDLLISRSVFFGTALAYNDMFGSTKNDSSGVARSLGGSYLSFMIHAGYTF